MLPAATFHLGLFNHPRHQVGQHTAAVGMEYEQIRVSLHYAA